MQARSFAHFPGHTTPDTPSVSGRPFCQSWRLAPAQVMRLYSTVGQVIEFDAPRSLRLWLTYDGDPRDFWLMSGQRLALQPGRDVLISVEPWLGAPTTSPEAEAVVRILVTGASGEARQRAQAVQHTTSPWSLRTA